MCHNNNSDNRFLSSGFGLTITDNRKPSTISKIVPVWEDAAKAIEIPIIVKEVAPSKDIVRD